MPRILLHRGDGGLLNPGLVRMPEGGSRILRGQEDCLRNRCCGPLGACCQLNGCYIKTEADCIASNTFDGIVWADWRGPDTVCPFDCIGACCFPGGVCGENSNRPSCEYLGNNFLGYGSDCSGNPCQHLPTGACCLSVTQCASMTQAECAAANGVFIGLGVSCAQITCEGTNCCRNPLLCVPPHLCLVPPLGTGSIVLSGNFNMSIPSCCWNGITNMMCEYRITVSATRNFVNPSNFWRCAYGLITGIGSDTPESNCPPPSGPSMCEQSDVYIYLDMCNGIVDLGAAGGFLNQTVSIPRGCRSGSASFSSSWQDFDCDGPATWTMSGTLQWSVTGMIPCGGGTGGGLALPDQQRRVLVPGADFVGGAGVEAAVRSAGAAGGKPCAGCLKGIDFGASQ